MKANKNTVKKPLFRITFARVMGHDEDGRANLAKPKEIGAVWPRRSDKRGAILNFDLIPVELTQRQGVIFLLPVDDNDEI